MDMPQSNVTEISGQLSVNTFVADFERLTHSVLDEWQLNTKRCFPYDICHLPHFSFSCILSKTNYSSLFTLKIRITPHPTQPCFHLKLDNPGDLHSVFLYNICIQCFPHRSCSGAFALLIYWNTIKQLITQNTPHFCFLSHFYLRSKLVSCLLLLEKSDDWLY